MRALARLALVGGIAVVAVSTTATPASAHGVGGVRPTNYETRVLSVSPVTPGVSVRAIDVGDRLELENRTDHDVVVLGYEDEPYLRVGPRGAFENARSPSTYLNRSRQRLTRVPDRADSDAKPEWRRIGDTPVARWHDHRAHWMAANDPPAVEAAPDRPHVVQRFRVEVRDQEKTITARGDVRWVPGPSPWPWIALAIIVAALLVVLSRTSVAVVAVAVALVAVIVVEGAHVVGAWNATTLGVGTRLAASVYALGSIVVAIVALAWVAKRGLHAAAPLLLITGLFVGIAGGLADLTVLTRSQLPTTLPDDVARAGVALALGLGIGLAVVGALRLRGPSTRTRPGAPRSRGTGQPVGATTS
jgi:hypothetical protein